MKVYRNAYAIAQLAQLIVEYPSIWESEDFIQILPEYWMKVPFKPGWEAKISIIKSKVYPLGNKA